MNDSNQEFPTETISDIDINKISAKLAAINNEVRFTILKILLDFERINDGQKRDPLYSREINVFLTNYNINITPQMLGQHLKILVESDLIEDVIVKKEIPNKIGRRNVKAYTIKSDAFIDLFLDINFFSQELLVFFELYEINQKMSEPDCCILTIFNGNDSGKAFKIHKNECAYVGRKANYDVDDFSNVNAILLDNSYYSVSNISKPHVKIFYEDGVWYVLDEFSSNGTYIYDKRIPKSVKINIKNNSFLKLSLGSGGVVIHCSIR